MPIAHQKEKSLRFFILAAISLTLFSSLLWNSISALESISFPIASSATPPLSYANAVEKAAPAVVSVHTTKPMQSTAHNFLRDPLFQQFIRDPKDTGAKETHPGLGSGVIVHKKGYVLTNYHVIQDATEITVTLADERSAEATVVGIDPDSDLAVLQLEMKALKNLPVIAFGTSDKLRVGDIVLAIGNPYGVGQTVTQGIISAIKRSNLGINTFESFIQTDAAINPGNSGGALIDTNGHLVAINAAILSSIGGSNQGIGFATPVDAAKKVMEQIIGQGYVTRGWLGVSIRDLSPSIRQSLHYPEGEGALVAGVLRQGPAQQAGLLPGDIVVSLNNQPITTAAELLDVVSALDPKMRYPISVIREGEVFDFRVTIEKRPPRQK